MCLWMCEFFHKLRVGNYDLNGKQNKSQKQNSKRNDKHLQFLEIGEKLKTQQEND